MAWSDVLGHERAKRLFGAHLASGEIPGAYLLAGPEGIGKRRLALEMAKALNCPASPGEPCDACPSCVQIHKGTHPDVHQVIPSGASDLIKIDDVRYLIGRAALRPFSAKTQVVLLDGAERLTEEAANSLLKALEEPTACTRFLLVTAQPSHCLPTILSRCQLVRCEPLPRAAVARLLISAHRCDPALAERVAAYAHGSVSTAATLASRWAALEAMQKRLAEASPEAWLGPSLPETREGVTELLDCLMERVRDLAVVAAADPTQVARPEHRDAAQRQARRVDVDRCVETAMELAALRQSVEQFVSPRLIASLAREQWLNLIAS